MKTVYCYVVTDIPHYGHIRHLKRAKKFGMLIVGLLTDKACMEKKPKPVTTYKERYEVIASLRCVDKVVMQDTYSPLNNCKNLHPDILVESESHPEQPANGYVKSYGGRVVVLPYTKGISSTIIKRRIWKENSQ